MKWISEPPPPNRRGRPTLYSDADLAELKANPGKWAELATYTISAHDKCRTATGAYQAAKRLREKGFDTRVVNATGELFAMWPEA